MKSFLSKLRLLVLLPILANFLSVNLAQAAGSPAFNNLTGDQEFLQGRNITKNGNWSDPVAANAGEQVDVAIYYHNTVVDSTAQNTRIHLTVPSNFAKTHLLEATLVADNVSAVTGSVVNGQEIGQAGLTINSETDSKVEFVSGSVRWYPNRMETNGAGATLPFGQTGDELVASQLRIGDIGGCFQFSGFVIAKVRLTAPQVEPKVALKIVKDVKSTGELYQDKVNAVIPGTDLRYRLTVTNLDETKEAKKVRIQDYLPAGQTYVAPTELVYTNGTRVNLPDGIISATGIELPLALKPKETVEIFFSVKTDSTIADLSCLKNRATASASNAGSTVEDTAEACFVQPKAILKIQKDVRKSPFNTDFIDKVRANPGTGLQYQITVRNEDGQGTAKQVVVKDMLPAGQAYVAGSATIAYDGGTVASLADGLISANGVTLPQNIKPLGKAVITFKVTTATDLKNETCYLNKATVSSATSIGTQEDTAESCFSVIVPATPMPTPQPVGPILPRTGPELNLLLSVAFSGAGVSAMNHLRMKNKLKKSLRNMHVL